MDPASRAAEDVASGRWFSPTDLREAEGWTNDQLSEYWSARAREQHLNAPARAPLAWPVSLVFIALSTGIAAGAERARAETRSRPWLIDLLAGLVNAHSISDRLERRRARELGVARVADLPGLPLRIRNCSACFGEFVEGEGWAADLAGVEASDGAVQADGGALVVEVDDAAV